MKKNLILLAVTLLLITSCGKSPQKARQELTKIGIAYTDEAFHNAIVKEDKVAIDLFITSEHDASFVLKDAIILYAGEENRDLNLVKQLIDNSSRLDVRHKDMLGISYNSALGSAVNAENMEIVKLLLKKGADVNYNNGEALENALLFKKNLKIAKFLIDKGADINAKNNNESLLYRAIVNDSTSDMLKRTEEPRIAPYLLDLGVEVNDGEDGNSASLVYAVMDQNNKLAETLLKKGANVDSTWQDKNSFASLMLGGNSRKYTLWEIAKDQPETIALLNKYSAKQKQARK